MLPADGNQVGEGADEDRIVAEGEGVGVREPLLITAIPEEWIASRVTQNGLSLFVGFAAHETIVGYLIAVDGVDVHDIVGQAVDMTASNLEQVLGLRRRPVVVMTTSDLADRDAAGKGLYDTPLTMEEAALVIDHPRGIPTPNVADDITIIW